MGYDLHISRTRDWVDAEHDPISREEWLAYVASHREWRLDEYPDHAECAMAIWSGPSEHDEPWVAWGEGRLTSKNPDTALRRKMHEIARELGAFLTGDDGEMYGADGQPVPEPAAAPTPRLTPTPRPLRAEPAARRGLLARLFPWLPGR